MNRNVPYALAAAALFGASTPFAKMLVGEISPWLLAGLLYLGSGIGLGIVRLLRDGGWKPSGLRLKEWAWLLGAISFGGVLGPVALMYGLTYSSGSTASLLLNLEAVFTALIAWVIFKENAGTRVVLGMVSIIAGGIALAWPSGDSINSSWLGPLAISGACLCWAIDNNLTRNVSGTDSTFIAGAKGLIAGSVNCALALMAGQHLPAAGMMLTTMLIGLIGYGASLVLFVLALRGLGTARTGAYFSIAPFFGATLALVLLAEPTNAAFWIACVLMSFGVWLHLTERHEHTHAHEPMEHSHVHVHDEDHQHEHEAGWEGQKAHDHPHQHNAVTHKHPHYPDIHHRHSH